MDREKIFDIYSRSNQTTYQLNPFATKDTDAYRLSHEDRPCFRSDFAIDRDRILYSGAYRRYHGKTQVFSFSNLFDEEMTNRNLHTTYVSQISRTISKILGLNLELVEAIALGHDLGHTPFGHDGEVALSNVCEKYGIGKFYHNIESLHIVDSISSQGNGLNLTFQVRDGIISHDGEVHDTILSPQRQKTETDIQSYIAKKKKDKSVAMLPATIEGCVVRVSDTIAYIGQDIEDAIRCNILDRKDIPADCQKYLGDTNSKIIDSLVTSVLIHSYEQDHVCFDEETSYYLKKLKAFNYERIYRQENVKKVVKNIEKCIEILFDKYMQDISLQRHDSNIFRHFLTNKSSKYLESFSDAERVRDFIATMTDRYFNEEIKDYLIPWK
jgi:dGTPase